MPVVKLRYKNTYATPAFAIAAQLRKIVSRHLNVVGRDIHEGGLTPNQIKIHYDEASLQDLNTRPIEIEIFAYRFPERVANCEIRKENIVREIREFLDARGEEKDLGCVILYLTEMAYGEF